MSTFTIDGTVTELMPEEGRKLFDSLARAELGVSGEEFSAAWPRATFPMNGRRTRSGRLEILTPFAA
jgi:hypothetical protein